MASDLQAANVAIKAAIETGWASATPIAWEGVQFTPPDSGSWLRVSLLWGEGAPATMQDTAMNDVAGVLHLDLFGRPGKGLGALIQLADSARDLVNRKTISGVRFGAASGPRPATAQEDGWIRRIVTVPFTVEETA